MALDRSAWKPRSEDQWQEKSLKTLARYRQQGITHAYFRAGGPLSGTHVRSTTSGYQQYLKRSNAAKGAHLKRRGILGIKPIAPPPNVVPLKGAKSKKIKVRGTAGVVRINDLRTIYGNPEVVTQGNLRLYVRGREGPWSATDLRVYAQEILDSNRSAIPSYIALAMSPKTGNTYLFVARHRYDYAAFTVDILDQVEREMLTLSTYRKGVKVETPTTKTTSKSKGKKPATGRPTKPGPTSAVKSAPVRKVSAKTHKTPTPLRKPYQRRKDIYIKRGYRLSPPKVRGKTARALGYYRADFANLPKNVTLSQVRQAKRGDPYRFIIER